jgi:hypothetical protein
MHARCGPNGVDVTNASRQPASSGFWPLLSLNFFMADMQAGIGALPGVFLLAHGWESGLIGTVMTVGGASAGALAAGAP